MLEQVIFYTIITGFLITVLLSPIFIPFLRRLKFGQSIREEGPKSHQKKSGTPTMGGLMILLSVTLSTLIMIFKFSEPSQEIYLLLFVMLSFGLLGFIDDFIKVVMKRNLGLTSRQKLIGQIVISVIFYLFYRRSDSFVPEISIPGTDIICWLVLSINCYFLARRVFQCCQFDRWFGRARIGYFCNCIRYFCGTCVEPITI
jgi:phospho-N-acetylmuramoyl-pentapeptide-transferase